MTPLEELQKALENDPATREKIKQMLGSMEFRFARRIVEATALESVQTTAPENNPVIVCHKQYVAKGMVDSFKVIENAVKEKKPKAELPAEWSQTDKAE